MRLLEDEPTPRPPPEEEGRPMKRAWQNQRGNGVILQPGQSATILDLRGSDESPELMTVALGFDVTGDGTSNPITDDIYLQALIDWGAGGISQQARLDFQNGTNVRLVASNVRVKAVYTPGADALTDRTGPQVTAYAAIAYGAPSFRSSPARFTQRAALGAFGSSTAVANLDVPKFANAFGLVTDVSTFSIVVTARATKTSDQRFNAEYLVNAPAPLESTFLLPQGARVLTLGNQDNAPRDATVVYGLML